MKGVSMSDWFTIQMFLLDDGVCEVLGHTDDYRKMRCTCSSYTPIGKCKHVKFSRKKMEETEGVLHLTIPPSVTDDEADSIMRTSESFREFVIKYGKVEYLP